MARSTISERMSDLPKLVELTKSLLERGDPIEKVAEKLRGNQDRESAPLQGGEGEVR